MAANLLQPKSIDQIMAGFKKTCDQLAAYSRFHEIQQQSKNETIAGLQAEVQEHARESARALTISDNIQRLFNT